MPKNRLLLTMLTVSALAGCTVPQDFQGSVTEITDRTVKVRGIYAMDGSAAQPTQAMILQAQEICPDARYISATPTPGDLDTFDYLFMCR